MFLLFKKINHRNDENAAIPMEVLKQFAELGAFGAVVPEKYEGAGNIFLQSIYYF